MKTSLIHQPTAEETASALTEFFAAARHARALAATAKGDLEAATPILVAAIRTGSGQGRRIEELTWSTWNGQHLTGLCDSLTGLDSNLGQAALAMLAARIHMGGDADPQLRRILSESGTQPPQHEKTNGELQSSRPSKPVFCSTPDPVRPVSSPESQPYPAENFVRPPI